MRLTETKNAIQSKAIVIILDLSKQNNERL